jgi:hypothetical protein
MVAVSRSRKLSEVSQLLDQLDRLFLVGHGVSP